MLVLCIGTVILDFSLSHFVQHSLYASSTEYYNAKGARMAAQLAATPAADLPTVVRAQALGARANVAVFDSIGHLVASASAADGNGLQPEAPTKGFTSPSGEITPQAPPETLSLRSTEPAVAGPVSSTIDGDLLDLSVPAGQYTVHFAFSLAGVDSTLHLLWHDFTIASLLALGLATFLAAFLARRVAQRLSRIVRFANRIASGELSARVEEGRLDEISEVAHALDSTAARLEESFKELDGSRRELAVLLDSMQEAVIGISPSSQVTWSNSKMKLISPSAVREGRSLVECVRDPDVLRCVAIALQDKEIGYGRATSFVPSRSFAVSAAPMPGGGAVVVLYDVTEIERTERMRRDFVANVSHELRTPLTSISGYVDTVLDSEERLSLQGREFLGIVLRNATRMNRLTADLLTLANVEARDYRIHPQPIAADELLDDALDALAGIAIDSGVELERLAAPPTLVLADLDALNQVFGNLIENAMKYGRAGKRVRVSARNVEDAVEFSVQDFGPGIASEHLERIFERFYRVDKARSRDSGGTGLGLAIVKHIILAHHGTIRAESELGSGSRFLFTLPLAAAPAATGHDGARRQQVSPSLPL
ncbi:sensor histidine kinase [Acidipila sp. EB88]|nr:sensor histidine kinase [Acidipila sp. EB88]